MLYRDISHENGTWIKSTTMLSVRTLNATRLLVGEICLGTSRNWTGLESSLTLLHPESTWELVLKWWRCPNSLTHQLWWFEIHKSVKIRLHVLWVGICEWILCWYFLTYWQGHLTQRTIWTSWHINESKIKHFLTSMFKLTLKGTRKYYEIFRKKTQHVSYWSG